MTIRQSVTRLGQMTAGRKSGRCGTFLKLEARRDCTNFVDVECFVKIINDKMEYIHIILNMLWVKVGYGTTCHRFESQHCTHTAHRTEQLIAIGDRV